jgi:hypothetical protein
LISISISGHVPFVWVRDSLRQRGIGRLLFAIAAEWLRIRQLILIFAETSGVFNNQKSANEQQPKKHKEKALRKLRPVRKSTGHSYFSFPKPLLQNPNLDNSSLSKSRLVSQFKLAADLQSDPLSASGRVADANSTIMRPHKSVFVPCGAKDGDDEENAGGEGNRLYFFALCFRQLLSAHFYNRYRIEKNWPQTRAWTSVSISLNKAPSLSSSMEETNAEEQYALVIAPEHLLNINLKLTTKHKYYGFFEKLGFCEDDDSKLDPEKRETFLRRTIPLNTTQLPALALGDVVPQLDFDFWSLLFAEGAKLAGQIRKRSISEGK